MAPMTVDSRTPDVAAGRTGGTDGNERLTASIATVLLLLLAAEGATILRIRQLISVHVFLGVLLIPPVAVKLASTGYRFLRYYTGNRSYRAKGPPPLLLRVLVAPAVVASTLILFGSGVALIALGPRRGDGLVLLLHKASFVGWFGAMSVHVLWHARRLPAVVGAEWRGRQRIGGRGERLLLVAAALAAGVALAVVTLPSAHAWSRLRHFDDRGAHVRR
jgi:hypothetical protein